MRQFLVSRWYFFLALLFFAFSITSCNTTKKVKYFQDIPDSGASKNFPKIQYIPVVIRAGDLLNVSVQTDDPMSSAGVISSANTSSASSSAAPSATGGAAGVLQALSGASQAQAPASGFPVDNSGHIDMPIIGKVMVAGYTLPQLTDTITRLASKYFKNPVVVVRLANFKVNITGEVLKPGQYIMPDEKESIVDAIAMAGDLTIFGKRENVLLIRENPDGTKTSYRINFKKSDILSSPLYYVRPNDFIYVEPRSAKSDANDAAEAKYITLGSAFLSLLIIIAYRINL